jgi:hypothetical protein
MKRNKLNFEHDSKKYCVVKPSFKQSRLSESYRLSAFKEAVATGAILQAALVSYMEAQGIISLEKTKSMFALMENIQVNSDKLKDETLSPEEGRAVALQIKLDRMEFGNMRTAQFELEKNTAESFSDDEKLRWLTAHCTLTEDGKPVWNSLEHFNQDYETELYKLSLDKMFILIRDFEEDYNTNLAENVYLDKLMKQEAAAKIADVDKSVENTEEPKKEEA